MLSQCNDSSFLFLPDFDIFRKNKKRLLQNIVIYWNNEKLYPKMDYAYFWYPVF